MGNGDYIVKLREKLSSLNDLIDLVNQLIDEREYLASTVRIDPLTGLNNRRILEKVRNFGSIVMCDIDYFKQINDTYGHEMGDTVIKKVGEILLQSIRIGDIACRYGGDEFLIIFNTDRQDVIIQRMETVMEQVKSTIPLPYHTITLSIGIAFQDENDTLESLIKKADQALYESKENGRNQISIYEKHKEYSKTEKSTE